MNIGFVGLGLMGTPMARHLVAAGHRLFINSRSAAALEELAASGAVVCDSPKEIAAQVEVFFSCRVTPEQSIETFLGERGAAQGQKQGLLCIDLATTDPDTAKTIGCKLVAAGMSFIDAPVSGGPNGAVNQTLTIMAGGEQTDLARARPLLEVLGKKIFHTGPVGAGVAAKLCNNMISITTHALVAEAMVMGVKAGVDAHQLYEVLRASSARSNTLERVVPNHFLTRDFEASASLTTIMKDLHCAIETGRKLGVRLLLPNVAMQCFVDAAGRGHIDKDIASVILPMEEIAGVKVGVTKAI